MKRRILCLATAVILLLAGCSWMDGSYVSVTPHQAQMSGNQSDRISASNYLQLRNALVALIQTGTESAVIHVAEYDQDLISNAMESAVDYICHTHPLGAYAVESLDYEIGSAGGQPAVSIEISYIHGRSEIRKIQQVSDMDAVEAAIAKALQQCDEGIVLQVRQYTRRDLVQYVEDFAEENPNLIMETPQVAVGLYPESGSNRILEIKFTYETSRDSLRSMQYEVARVFASASLYINQNDPQIQKYTQLYNFLMERFDYQFQTSITPSYSLLNHGVGDAKAFAEVYSAMCRQAGLDCRVISGTRSGEAWYWNLICDEGVYYHVDLLQSYQSGRFTRLMDWDMQNYVWDYSAYPQAIIITEEPVPTE